MDLIELTLRGVMLVSALFVACGFGGLACEAIESAMDALDGIDG